MIVSSCIWIYKPNSCNTRHTCKILLCLRSKRFRSVLEHGQNQKSRSLVFLCSETKRKRLLCRLSAKINMANSWTSCTVHVRAHEMTSSSAALLLDRKAQKFSGTNQKPERPRPFGTGGALFAVLYFSSRHFFPPFWDSPLPLLPARWVQQTKKRTKITGLWLAGYH